MPTLSRVQRANADLEGSGSVLAIDTVRLRKDDAGESAVDAQRKTTDVPSNLDRKK